MAANQLVQTRIDGAIKEEAATVLAAMGLTLEYSLHLFTYRANYLQSQLGGAARQAAAAADLIWIDAVPPETGEPDPTRMATHVA